MDMHVRVCLASTFAKTRLLQPTAQMVANCFVTSGKNVVPRRMYRGIVHACASNSLPFLRGKVLLTAFILGTCCH